MAQEISNRNDEQGVLRKTFYNEDDELDLLDVIVQLWKGKKTIIATVVAFLILALIYLFLAKEKWTSQAILTQPSSGQVANYNSALNVLYSQNPQDKISLAALQQQIFNRFNASISALSGSLQNLDDPRFLNVEPVNKNANAGLTVNVKMGNDNDVTDSNTSKKQPTIKADQSDQPVATQQKITSNNNERQSADGDNATPPASSAESQEEEQQLALYVEQVTKGRDDPLRIKYTAESAREAQQLLTRFIDVINKEVVDDYMTDIMHNLAAKERELSESLANQQRIAQGKKDQRLAALKQALKVAEASDINNSQLSQAEYLSDDTLYLLGSKALAAMIANEATRPLVFDDNYYQTQAALLAIRALVVQPGNLQAYRYIVKPDLPVRRDSPKKGLTLVLAVLLGGIFGSAVVLGRNMIATYRARHNA